MAKARKSILIVAAIILGVAAFVVFKKYRGSGTQASAPRISPAASASQSPSQSAEPAAMAALAVPAPPPSASAPAVPFAANSNLQKIVLVSGPLEDAQAFWAPVAEQLRTGPNEVVIVDLGKLPVSGEHVESDSTASSATLSAGAAAIRSAVGGSRGAILVAHSTSGLQVTAALDGLVQQLAKVVYLGGLLPTNHQSAVELLSGDATSALPGLLRTAEGPNLVEILSKQESTSEHAANTILDPLNPPQVTHGSAPATKGEPSASNEPAQPEEASTDEVPNTEEETSTDEKPNTEEETSTDEKPNTEEETSTNEQPNTEEETCSEEVVTVAKSPPGESAETSLESTREEPEALPEHLYTLAAEACKSLASDSVITTTLHYPADRQVSHDLLASRIPCDPLRGARVWKVYVLLNEAKLISPELQKKMSAAAMVQRLESLDADESAPLSKPREVAALILKN